MARLTPLFTAEEIHERVAAVARDAAADYADSSLVIVGVLKGAFIFLADLVRQLNIPLVIDFVRIASYGSGGVTSGNHRLTKPLEADIQGKDVLVVEDIVDSGLTMTFLLDYLKSLRPRSVAICALIDKTERREAEVQIQYACFHVEQGFLVGYGLDYDEQHRCLPGIYTLEP